MIELSHDCLWTDYQPMSAVGLPLGRRVAVARGSAGQLVVFSPLEVSETVLNVLQATGKISAFILPSRFHVRFYEGYFEAFKDARFLAGHEIIKDHPHWPLTEI